MGLVTIRHDVKKTRRYETSKVLGFTAKARVCTFNTQVKAKAKILANYG